MALPTTITLHPRMSDGSRIEDGSTDIMGPTDPQQIIISDPSVWVSEVLDHGTGLWGFADVRPILTPADLSMPADKDAGRVLTTRMTMFGLDANGLLTFGGDQQLRWSELVRASDAGLISGDITNMVIYVDRGVAGGGAHEIYQLIDFLFSERNLQYAEHLKGVYGAVALYILRKPLLALPKARIRYLARQFRKRGITGSTLMFWVDKHSKRWDVARLAAILALTDAETRVLLSEFGYEPDEHGLFTRSTDPELMARRRAVFTNAVQSPDTSLGDPIVLGGEDPWWDEDDEDL